MFIYDSFYIRKSLPNIFPLCYIYLYVVSINTRLDTSQNISDSQSKCIFILKPAFLGYEEHKQDSMKKWECRGEKLRLQSYLELSPLCIVYIIRQHSALYASQIELTLFLFYTQGFLGWLYGSNKYQ